MVRITEAPLKRQFQVINDILAQEKDPFVRQLILHAFGRRSLLADAIRFVHSERQTANGAAMKAMVVAKLSPKQIAQEVGTGPFFVIVFEMLVFDVRRYQENRTRLKLLCYEPVEPAAPAYRLCEARWLPVAFARGWSGLKPIISGPLEVKPPTGEEEVNRVRRILVSRAGDGLTACELAGLPPSERDLELLVLWERGLRHLLTATAAEALSYPEFLDLEQEKKQAENEKLVARLSPESRRKIMAYVQRITEGALRSD